MFPKIGKVIWGEAIFNETGSSLLTNKLLFITPTAYEYRGVIKNKIKNRIIIVPFAINCSLLQREFWSGFW